MKSVIRTILILSLVASECFSQLNFEVNPLVQIEGYNTSFKISNSEPWAELSVYICWENTIDSSTFNIYRMVVEPYLGAPELISSSNNILRSPDVNLGGDLAWEELVGEISTIKYYESNTDSTSTLANGGVSATEPQLFHGGLVYIHGDTLKLLDFESDLHHNLDHSGISNPDLANEPYSPYVTVAYEKREGIAQFIRTLITSNAGSGPYITDFGQDYQCANPSYGTSYLLAYQALVDSSWSVGTEWGVITQPFNATKPFIVSTGIITMREVITDLTLFENDSTEGDCEIYCYDYGSTYSNISNSPGNDYNPQAFYTNRWDSVAVIWEHEVEDGRELWWAKDTLKLPVSVAPGIPILPKSFSVGNAYPNPFNGNTHIKYSVRIPSTVEISVFDLSGRLISNVQEIPPAGTHSYSWNGLTTQGQACESGVYLLTFSGGRSSVSRKVVLLK